MANDVNVEVGLDVATFQKEMDKLGKSVEKLGNQINSTMDTKVTKPLDVFKGTLGALAVDRGLSFVTEQFKKLGDEVARAIDVAVKKQAELQKLQFTLTGTGRGATQATADFAKFADMIEQTTVFTDDAALSSATLLAQTTRLSNQGIKEAVKAATDLATILGVDLETATRSLIKAYDGQLDRNLKLIKGIREGRTEQETYANVMNFLAGRAGIAGASLETYGGKAEQLGKSFENLQESLGNVVINNDTVKGFVDAIKAEFDSATSSIDENAISMSEVISDTIYFFLAFGKAVLDTADVIGRAFRIMYDIVMGVFKGITVAVNSTLLAVANTVTGFVGLFDEELGANMKATYADFEKGTNDLANSTVESFKDIGDALVGETYISKVSQGLDRIANKTAEFRTKEKKLNDTDEEEKAQGKRLKSQQELEAEAKLQADITSLRQQAILERQNLEAQLAIPATGDINEFDKKQLELDAAYQFEQDKLLITYQAEVDKNAFIKNEDEKRLANVKAARDLELKQEQLASKNKLSIKENEAARKKKIEEGELLATNNFISAGLQLASEGSAIQKGLMYTQAIVNTYAGATRALVDYPAPASYAVAASVIALGLANVAKIAGAKFESGGIVGGSSLTGDDVQVNVNSREMILTTQQQAELFRLANGGGSANRVSSNDLATLVDAIRSTPIVVQANGREIARLVREESRGGFSFA